MVWFNLGSGGLRKSGARGKRDWTNALMNRLTSPIVCVKLTLATSLDGRRGMDGSAPT